MPTAPAPRPERDFCSNCGFPVRGSRCEACGTAQDARSNRDDGDVPTKQNQFRPYASQADADVAGLERAFEALRAKDLPHFVEHIVASEAGSQTARSVSTADGVGWVAAVRGANVFVTLRATSDEIVMEAPIARLPGHQRLPALRLALELCGRDAATSRVCIRGELLLLRFAARLSLLTPPVLRYYLREIGHLAAQYSGLMTVSLDALPALPDDQRPVGFDAIGRPKKIHLGTGGSIRRSIPPPPPQERSQPGHDGSTPKSTVESRSRAVTGTRPLRRDEEPSSNGLDGAGVDAGKRGPDPLSGPKPRAGSVGADPAAKQRALPDVADFGTAETIPAILSPMFSAPAAVQAPVVPKIPSAPPSEPTASQAELNERHKRSQTAQTGTIPAPADPPSRRSPPTGGAGPEAAPVDRARRTSEPGAKPRSEHAGAPRQPEAELDTASRRAITGTAGVGAAPGAELSASDRLCMLLRHAQSLASLTLEERPATMNWLVRSAVFRAIYDFKDLLPDAVAHLYRCTGVGRDAPGSARSSSSSQLQATEPALVVMERVIVARAQVQREKALAIEPMTSAAQAKDHVARYLTEIDRSPGDPPLRHFLALGALTELLVRTKLPPQTDQRLRDIVAHAQREGAKNAAIDLMMTALQRINS